MIIELNGVDKTTLQQICRCDAAEWNCAGIILVKEDDQGKMLYWNVRVYRFESLVAHAKPLPYKHLGRAYNSLKEHGGRLVLWLRPDVIWSNNPLIAGVIAEKNVMLYNGELVPAVLVEQVRKRLSRLDAPVRNALVSLCKDKEKLGEHERQLRALDFVLLDTEDVAPAIKGLILEMAPYLDLVNNSPIQNTSNRHH